MAQNVPVREAMPIDKERRITRLTLIGLFSFIGFCAIAMTFQLDAVGVIDGWIIQSIQQQEAPFWTGFMKLLSFIGSGQIVTVFSGIAALLLINLYKRRTEALFFLVTVIGSALLNILLKLYFQRERPDLHTLITETGYSFPSGHSMNAFTFYGIVSYLFWRRIQSKRAKSLLLGFSSLMIVLIGISRVYLGVHYPSDIAGAYLISGVWLILMIKLYRYIKKRKVKYPGSN
ncbi:phosphatase PAP2 family protein [Paenibacillus abyssi]|uniref:phosphatase PAP2 family protein n=1 Tax=Paenibacillus abyssi TaxID=1340531 RepID=UPI00166CCCC4|nr:phosphatase PAP2 family protein [Paenibacillus abyssi]